MLLSRWDFKEAGNCEGERKGGSEGGRGGGRGGMEVEK